MAEIASTAANFDNQIAAAQTQRDTLQEQLTQYEAAYDAALAQIEGQLSALQEQLSPRRRRDSPPSRRAAI